MSSAEVGDHREHAAMRLRVRAEPQLGEDLLDVGLDRALGDEQPRRDRAVGEALGDELEHLPLARGQLVERILAAPAADEPRDDRGVHDGLAVDEPSQRVDEDRDVEHALLEQVADALGMLLEQAQRVARLDVVREQQHAGLRGARARICVAATSPSSVCVGGMRMSTIATSGRWSRTWRSSAGPSSTWRDDLDVGAFEQPHDALAREHRVLGDDYAHGSSARRT